MMKENSESGPDLQISICEEEIKGLMESRAMSRAVNVVVFVFLAVIFFFVASSPIRDEEKTCCRPRVILLVVPHLHPGMLEEAMASNKAPFLGHISAFNGTYTRLYAKNTDLRESLVTIFTGKTSPGAASLAGKTSFLGKLKRAGKKPVVLAPQLYWSTKGSANDSCDNIGLLDAECFGFSCPQESQAAYCNALERFLSCEDRSQLYNEDAVEAFKHLIQNDGDILYVHTWFSSGMATTSEDRMAILSDISVVDSIFGKLALAAMEHSRVTSESWLLMVVGAGDGRLKEVPLVMTAYAKGATVRLGSIPKNATLADISPTVLHWYGLSSPNDSQWLRGICSTGVAVENCPSTGKQL